MRIKIKCTSADGRFLGMSLFPVTPFLEKVIGELPEETARELLQEKYVNAFAGLCHKFCMDDDIHVQIDLIKMHVSKA